MRGAAPIEVSGQVDRLAVTRDSVLIADYKTDRAVPAHLAEAPKPYVGQLSLYRALLGAHLPGENDSRRIDLHGRAKGDRGPWAGHGGGIGRYCGLEFGRNRRAK